MQPDQLSTSLLQTTTVGIRSPPAMRLVISVPDEAKPFGGACNLKAQMQSNQSSILSLLSSCTLYSHLLTGCGCLPHSSLVISASSCFGLVVLPYLQPIIKSTASNMCVSATKPQLAAGPGSFVDRCTARLLAQHNPSPAGPHLPTTRPSLLTRNLLKFHLRSLDRKPPFSFLSLQDKEQWHRLSGLSP